MLRLLATALFTFSLATGFAQARQETASFPEFADYSETSRIHVDYTIWSDLLRDIVLNVPIMDRRPERRQSITTGTRNQPGSQSRYRYEANRVAYHLLSDEYKAAISEYRRELEALPEQVDLARLNSNEQLAYWLNLHNVAMIEQVMLEYPLTWINRMAAHGSREPVHEAKILTVAGTPLSLNDIRLRIVYEQWDDPRVLYGFFNGSVGSPEINRNAFDGRRVWDQLDTNAREFVNSLRGVDVTERELRVSHIYDDGRDFFPAFDSDLRAHLAIFANDETASQLAPGRPVYATVSDWHIADLINGVRRCTGTAGASLMYSGAVNQFASSEGIVTDTSCGILPPHGVELINEVQFRRLELIRQGRYGEVFTRDIPTDPDGNPIQLRPAGNAASSETESSETPD